MSDPIPRGTGRLTPPITGSTAPLRSTSHLAPATAKASAPAGPAIARDRVDSSSPTPAEATHPNLDLIKVPEAKSRQVETMIEVFRGGYQGGATAIPQGASPDYQGSNSYIAGGNPLAHAIVAAGEEGIKAARAIVSLGVDPGGFFCGGQTKALADLKKDPTFGQTRTGFLHLPPDRENDGYDRDPAPTRVQNLEMTAQVLSDMVKGVVGRDGDRTTTVLLTGFGPFNGFANNPTQDFVQDGHGNANRDNLITLVQRAFPDFQATPGNPAPLREAGSPIAGYAFKLPGGRTVNLMTGVMQLNKTPALAAKGEYYQSMKPVSDAFHQILTGAMALTGGKAPDAIISMGVDGSQGPGSQPQFKVETQSRGFGASDQLTANTDMAKILLEDHQMPTATIASEPRKPREPGTGRQETS